MGLVDKNALNARTYAAMFVSTVQDAGRTQGLEAEGKKDSENQL